MESKAEPAAVSRSSEWSYFAHYLRNVLGVIGAIAEHYLKNPPSPEAIEKLLHQIQRASKESDAYIGAFVSLSSPVVADRSPLAFSSWIKERVQAHPISRRPGIQLELKLPHDLESVEADGSLLGQAVDAVLDNASDAMPESGRLGVETWLDDETVFIAVRNTGEPISEMTLPDIGKPFLTLKQGHLGLGLSRAKRILTAHGGDVVAANIPTGVEIVLRLARRERGGAQ